MAMPPIEEDEMEDKVPLMSGHPTPVRSDIKEAAFENHPDPWGKGYKELYCICLLLYLSMQHDVFYSCARMESGLAN